MEELKPCPFCGGKATIEDGYFHKYAIVCGDCGAEAEQKLILLEIIKAWNTRTDQ